MSVLDDYCDEIEEFADQTLCRYLEEFTAPVQGKEINDPVWGTISVGAGEAYILDSPLHQRLRRVRQLGVVHLVYPSALHTRFEHSLGVLDRVTQLASSISSASDGREVLKDREVRLLRFTALFHDVGHGLMSHVSENALAGRAALNELEGSFNALHGTEQKKLSEIAAYYLVKSPAVQELLERAFLAEGYVGSGSEVAEFVADTIVGARDLGGPLQLHELITGPYDADKLDYLARDAYFCGVPQLVDVNRLVQKIRVVPVDAESLPDGIAKRVDAKAGRHYLTCVDASGARTIDELALARALLFDKVYRHQKVRAAEAMVRSVFDCFQVDGAELCMVPLRLVDEQILDATAIQLDPWTGDSERTEAALDLIRRLRDRQLFVRAFGWSGTGRLAGGTFDNVQSDIAYDATLAVKRRPQNRAMAERIASLAVEIADRLDETEQWFHQIKPEVLPLYIQIDPPLPSKGRSLVRRAYLVQDDDSVRKFGDEFPDTEGWTDQYIVNREVGYVFAPKEIAPLVSIATETLLFDKFAMNQSRIGGTPNGALVEDLRLRLRACGFFNECPGSNLSCVSGETGSPSSDSYINHLLHFPIGANSNVGFSYSNSIVYAPGGGGGIPGTGGSSSSINFSTPWEDNFCEHRSWSTSQCAGGQGHQGQDIRPRTDTPAPGPAVPGTYPALVSYSSTTVVTSSGHTVKLRYGLLDFLYLHLSPRNANATVGARLDLGERVGMVNKINTGITHLHFEIKLSGVHRSPYRSLTESFQEKWRVRKSDWENNHVNCMYGVYYDFDFARWRAENNGSNCGNSQYVENALVNNSSTNCPDTNPCERVYFNGACNAANQQTWSMDPRNTRWWVGPGRNNFQTPVYRVQYDLYRAGYNPSWNLDCLWGSTSETAVRSFQSCNFLSVDGVVGTNTWGKMVDLNKTEPECSGAP